MVGHGGTVAEGERVAIRVIEEGRYETGLVGATRGKLTGVVAPARGERPGVDQRADRRVLLVRGRAGVGLDPAGPDTPHLRRLFEQPRRPVHRHSATRGRPRTLQVTERPHLHPVGRARRQSRDPRRSRAARVRRSVRLALLDPVRLVRRIRRAREIPQVVVRDRRRRAEVARRAPAHRQARRGAHRHRRRGRGRRGGVMVVDHRHISGIRPPHGVAGTRGHRHRHRAVRLVGSVGLR